MAVEIIEGGLSWAQRYTSRFHKIRGGYWPDEKLSAFILYGVA